MLDIFISQIQQVGHAKMLNLMSSVITTMCLTLSWFKAFSWLKSLADACSYIASIMILLMTEDFDKRWLCSEVEGPVVYWIARSFRFSSPHSHTAEGSMFSYALTTRLLALAVPKPFELVGKDTVSMIEYRHLWKIINLPFDLRGIC